MENQDLFAAGSNQVKRTAPALEEWRALFAAAAEFKQLEPWRLVKETDIFGVANRQSGEIGYCCIMGELGEVFGMAVYRGTAGLQGYENIRTGKIKPGGSEILFCQDCLLVSFDDREDLEESDRRLIRDLGLKFRGRNSWPMFRDYKPGYFPWTLDRDGVLWMMDALQQAREVCSRVSRGDVVLKPPKKGLCLVRLPVAAGGIVVWRDEWREPAPVVETAPAQAPLDELRLRKIRQAAQQTQVAWEVDFFNVPVPVFNEVRPYFPYAMAIVNSDSGLILAMHLASADGYRWEFIERFLVCIEENRLIPKEIMVSNQEVAHLLGPWASNLRVQVRVVKKLKTLAKVRRELERHMGGA